MYRITGFSGFRSQLGLEVGQDLLERHRLAIDQHRTRPAPTLMKTASSSSGGDAFVVLGQLELETLGRGEHRRDHEEDDQAGTRCRPSTRSGSRTSPCGLRLSFITASSCRFCCCQQQDLLHAGLAHRVQQLVDLLERHVPSALRMNCVVRRRRSSAKPRGRCPGGR